MLLDQMGDAAARLAGGDSEENVIPRPEFRQQLMGAGEQLLGVVARGAVLPEGLLVGGGEALMAGGSSSGASARMASTSERPTMDIMRVRSGGVGPPP